MDIRSYDGQCVRITDKNGDVFDGICRYRGPERDERGRDCREGSLWILRHGFYESDIQDVTSLERHEGPYGRFLDPFGRIEETAAQSSIDDIVDILFCSEKEHVHRMLRCLDKYLDPCFGHEFDYRFETIGALKRLADVTKDEYVRVSANRLITMWGKSQDWK